MFESSGNNETEVNDFFCCIQPYTNGTMNNAANVDAMRPPMTARPNGAD